MTHREYLMELLKIHELLSEADERIDDLCETKGDLPHKMKLRKSSYQQEIFLAELNEIIDKLKLTIFNNENKALV